MDNADLVDTIEQLMIAGVAVTVAALARADVELTMTQWRVIAILARPQPVGIADIARRVGVTLPATSRLVHRLVDRGLVSVDQDPGDARSSIVTLTREGRAIHGQVSADRRAAIARIATPDLGELSRAARDGINDGSLLVVGSAGRGRG